MTVFVLKYRMVEYGHPAPLQDVLRAVRLVRSRAAEFGVKPDRIGVAGGSAGGHLAACAATKFAEPMPPADERPGASVRPDFCALIYPVISMVTAAHSGSRTNLLGRNPSEQLLGQFSCEKLVNHDTPPSFVVHARDDTNVPVTNSLMFVEACQHAGVPVELHLYETGGHGFGLGVHGGEVTNWPAFFETFLNHLP